MQFEHLTSHPTPPPPPDKRKLRGALLVPSEGLQDTLSHLQPLSSLLDTGDFLWGGGGGGGGINLIKVVGLLCSIRPTRVRWLEFCFAVLMK